MKLIGRDVKFIIQVPGDAGLQAGAYFNDVSFNEEASTIDVSTAMSSPGQQRVDDSDARATISATGFLDTKRGDRTTINNPNPKPNNNVVYTSYWNFIDLAQVGRVVDVALTVGGDSTMTGNPTQNKIGYYAPWQISKASFKHGKRAASEDTIVLIGTGGAVDTSYFPGQVTSWGLAPAVSMDTEGTGTSG